MSNLTNTNELKAIIAAIKKVNDSRDEENTISTDDTNEELVNIFHDVMNSSDIELEDDEASLTSLFGYDGCCEIREAEQGIY
ncbi:hypothetical protein [Pseudoalteromonas sp. 5-MNA-CIBAN-0065]|uniref:hypothetical protein n=1 Tax=Pseudoalteromonas sp. 5-MNA-CIBAN-0065 TaxID=3140421 RepID=UPI0033293A7B